MNSTRIQIRTPSRLHFGLLGWGPQSSRQFGGVGLMIQDPGLDLTAEVSQSWSVEGPLAERAARTIDRLREHASIFGIDLRPARVRVESVPAEHVGLGVGTQLALAITTAVWRLSGGPQLAVSQLGFLSGRGLRSGIGLHGFSTGGLIVDGGRKPSFEPTHEGSVPPLLSRLEFPDDWHILVIRPSRQNGLHGQEEVRAFHELPAVERNVTDRLCRIILLELLPAVIEHDLSTFGAAISQIQASVGASFAAAQGGLYSASTSSSIISEMTNAGLKGAGQSSWGPTLYAFSDQPEAEIAAIAESWKSRFELESDSVLITRADNTGARVTTELL